MIKASALSELLKKVIANGIEIVLISNTAGEILCMESNHQNEIITDDISSIWIEYENVGNELDEKLNYLLIENDTSNVLTSNLYGYIITIIANKKFKLGLLKYHLEHIVNFLSISLEPYKDVLLSKND